MKRKFRAIRPLSLHCPSTILSKLEPVVGLGLLACPSGSSGQLRRLRKLHQFALNSCDNTQGLGKIFNRSFRELPPSVQCTLREMIFRFGARFGARFSIENSLRSG